MNAEEYGRTVSMVHETESKSDVDGDADGQTGLVESTLLTALGLRKSWEFIFTVPIQLRHPNNEYKYSVPRCPRIGRESLIYECPAMANPFFPPLATCMSSGVV